MTDEQQSPPQLPRESEHKDWIERVVGSPFYVRYQQGPDPSDGWYERAYLCVDDGEPDMNDLATFYSHGTARSFVEAQRIYLNALSTANQT